MIVLRSNESGCSLLPRKYVLRGKAEPMASIKGLKYVFYDGFWRFMRLSSALLSCSVVAPPIVESI